jgi:Mce-associated membrane protein
MEGDAGARRLNPTVPGEGVGPPLARGVPPADDSTDDTELVSEAPADSAPEAEVASDVRGSRVSRGWFVAIFVLLLVLAGGVAAGGYLTLRSHDQNLAAARAEDQAVAAAKDCVSATNAPDPAAMAASVQKIIDCSTGDFGAYAKMMAPMMVEAYQAANIKVDVTDMRAAAERHNGDGSIDVLVAFRFRAPSNPDTQNQEIGLRLRALMMPEDGRYKIAKLDPVMT